MFSGQKYAWNWQPKQKWLYKTWSSGKTPYITTLERWNINVFFFNTIDKAITNSSYLPPASLQLLIENAIKHNKFTNDNPLRIKLFNDDEYLIVSNNINIRNDSENSTNQGLDNLTRRYSHLSDKPVVIKKSDVDFTVSLPILTKEQYERFNIWRRKIYRWSFIKSP